MVDLVFSLTSTHPMATETVFFFDVPVSIVGFLLNCALAFLLARRPPGLIGRYRPIQSSVVALDTLRCLLIPFLASKASFLSHRLTYFSVASLLHSAVVATVTSQSSVIIIGFVYRFFTLKGTRLNGLLSVKWIFIIVSLTFLQCTAQLLYQRYVEHPRTSQSWTHYFIVASSFMHEGCEVAKFVCMLSMGLQTHRFIRCAIFTRQATRMHQMGLKVIAYQALTHFIFSLLPLILLPRVTTRFTEAAMAFNGLQTIIDPMIVIWLTPHYRRMLRRRRNKKRTITYASGIYSARLH